MTNPTSNYGFVLPTATDLVTDLPADFEVALQGVDTRLKALQPGTTLGDIAYSSATANTSTRLPVGTNGQVLAVVAGVPAWQNGTTGDIEGVTAGVGITGGGTSGTVTVTNDMATTITASGDIVVGTGSGTYDNLPIGTTGQILTADTTVSPYKVKWAAPAGGGKVLQVVYATEATEVTNSTSTYADSLITATITPTSATSKILVLISMACEKSVGSTANRVALNLVRSGTQIIEWWSDRGLFTDTAMRLHGNLVYNYLDAPATTSARIYKVQIKNNANVAYVKAQPDNNYSSITLLEIGA